MPPPLNSRVAADRAVAHRERRLNVEMPPPKPATRPLRDGQTGNGDGFTRRNVKHGLALLPSTAKRFAPGPEIVMLSFTSVGPCERDGAGDRGLKVDRVATGALATASRMSRRRCRLCS